MMLPPLLSRPLPRAGAPPLVSRLLPRADLLMKGPSGVYVKEHGSWPGFMASVTLQLSDQQTVL
jgi:hypothetical protein